MTLSYGAYNDTLKMKNCGIFFTYGSNIEHARSSKIV